MSTKDWKNRELPSLLTEKWGFSFNMLTESQEEEVVEEGMCGTCGKSPCCCPTMEEGEEVEEGVFKGRTGDDEDLPNSVAAAKKKRRDDVYKDAVKGYYGEKDYRNRLEEEEELDEGASSSGRVATPDRAQNGDRREDDERKRPMEEAEKPDFPDVDGDGDREEPISKASKEKKEDKGEDKEEKSDKDMSKVPPQLRKHVKGKMDEAQIRSLIRKLVKEAMAKKETK